jgi:pimeloyl-ACP methyl ester carboxylesterase
MFAALSEVQDADRVVVLLPGGGYTFSPQRNRWGVRLADAVGARGLSTVRLDWPGIGDSSGEADRFDLAHPNVEDARQVLAAVRDRGYRSWIAVGNCFGARTALALADENPAGVVLISPPVRDHARGEGTATRMAQNLDTGDFLASAARKMSIRDLTDPVRRRRAFRIARTFLSARLGRARTADPAPWVAPQVVSGLARLVEASVPVLILFGRDDTDLEDFELACAGRLGEVVGADSVQVKVVDGSMHGLTTVAAQDTLIDTIDVWLGAGSNAAGSHE